jgi:hypothetical protein
MAIDERDALPHPMQPIGRDASGVVRFKENRAVSYLLAEASEGRRCDMNDLVRACQHGAFPEADMVQLAQLIGYSVAGFGDLSYAPPDVVAAADEIVARLLGDG